MIDRKTNDQSIKNDKVKYENIRKIATGQERTIQLVVCQTISISKIMTK